MYSVYFDVPAIMLLFVGFLLFDEHTLTAMTSFCNKLSVTCYLTNSVLWSESKI